MKTEFREGDVVRSLLDGMFYRVLNISEESVTAETVEEEEADGKRVFVGTPADMIDVDRQVFDELFYVVEKAPAAVPDEGMFTISNNMFLKGGKRVETGTLVPVEIMARIPGAVLLTVRSRTEGKLDLFHYDVETDEFHKLTNAKDDIWLAYSSGPITGFATTKRETVEIPSEKDGDSTEQAEAVIQSVRFYNGCSWLYSTEGNLDSGEPLIGELISSTTADDWNGRKTHVVQFATSDACKCTVTTDGRYVWVRDTENDGKRTRVTKIELVYEDGSYPMVNSDQVSFSGSIEKVLFCRDEDHNSVFVTTEGIVHSNYGHGKRLAIGKDVLEAVEQYPVPVSLSFNGSRDTTFIFGNENYGACRIRVVKTCDRGFVTTVEEIG